jgi:carboxyl-terminal processing protease
MPAWNRRLFAIVSAVLLLTSDARSAVPPSVGRPPNLSADAGQFRAEAAAAERAGDWEAAFAAYCRLYTADRQSPDVREKLNHSLRRVQQFRRHHDQAFRQFTLNLPVADGLDLFRDVLLNVPPLYADRDKATPQLMWEHGVEELDRALVSPAFRLAYLDDPSPQRVEAFRTKLRTVWAKRSVSTAKEARVALRQLIAAAQDAFPVRFPAAIAVEFVCGSCAGLDEYTVFLSPGEFAPDPAAVADLSAHGLYLGVSDGGLVIEGVAVGSWAALHTQLRKGDRIVRVNGRTMDLTASSAVAEALRTPTDGSHEVEAVTAGSAMPRVFQFPVVVPTVYGTGMVPDRDGVGYVRIGSFAPGTLGELDDAIAYLKARGARVLILDLRGNHGGSFTTGVEVARRLLPSGIIVTTQGQIGEVANRVFSSDRGMSALDLPLVVLIDAETASAAEVVAAALKDNGRAVVVGMASFGKGAVQIPVKLAPTDDMDDPGRRPRSTGVRVTIARLFSPRGTPINGSGVTPNTLEADPVRQLQLAIDRALEQLPSGPRMPMPPPTIP